MNNSPITCSIQVGDESETAEGILSRRLRLHGLSRVRRCRAWWSAPRTGTSLFYGYYGYHHNFLRSVKRPYFCEIDRGAKCKYVPPKSPGSQKKSCCIRTDRLASSRHPRGVQAVRTRRAHLEEEAFGKGPLRQSDSGRRRDGQPSLLLHGPRRECRHQRDEGEEQVLASCQCGSKYRPAISSPFPTK